jgi:hypothetical protein
MLISQTNADIICLSIGWFNGWDSPTHNPISETEYNKIIQRICAEYRIGYIDVYHAMINSGVPFNDMTYPPDRVHPNDTGAQIWTDEVWTWFDYQGCMVESALARFALETQWAVDAGIIYSGTWINDGPFASTFGKEVKRSSTAGSTATFDYIGSKIKIYLVRDVDKGKVKVTMDGAVLYAEYDCYATSFEFSPLIIENAYGKHRLVLEVLGTKNAASSNTIISLSKVDNYIDTNRSKEYIDTPYILPENLSTSAGRSIDTHAGYYFGKAVGVTSSASVVGSIFTRAYGDKFKIIYTKFTAYGNLDIYVDGVLYGSVDAYAAAASRRNIFEITGLTLNYHVIEIKTNGTKNAASTGYGINIEGILCHSVVREFRGNGTHNVPVTFQFYEAPNVQVTPTSNCTAYISAVTEQSVTVQTNPTGGTFNVRAEGY